ncbi:pseudouridine synthase [Acidovorax lacteus]|uniref:Pseudouridine synthase n=2 Tax=Acidovorax lacteus TaxID=1924988 RepID=A0ABP8L1E6_9BURK
MARGEVVSEHGEVITPETPLRLGVRLYYYRELRHEPSLPFSETVIYRDDHLLVADKPHFMPVIPTGRYLQRSLLVRLRKQWGLPDLSPVHRIDRDTAGLVLFSVQRSTRDAYQALFRERMIRKTYEAVAALPPQLWPCEYHSRIEESPQFFRMHEVPGPANSLTRIALLEQSGPWGLFQLEPITGRRHQLRVHMAALGMPVHHDPFYPVVNDPPEGDYSRPLQLLARSLEFQDPVTGQRRFYRSQRSLNWPPQIEAT